VATPDKTLIAFITSVVTGSLFRIPIKCVINITESFKTAYDFLLDIFDFITDSNEMISINPD